MYVINLMTKALPQYHYQGAESIVCLCVLATYKKITVTKLIRNKNEFHGKINKIITNRWSSSFYQSWKF